VHACVIPITSCWHLHHADSWYILQLRCAQSCFTSQAVNPSSILCEKASSSPRRAPQVVTILSHINPLASSKPIFRSVLILSRQCLRPYPSSFRTNILNSFLILNAFYDKIKANLNHPSAGSVRKYKFTKEINAVKEKNKTCDKETFLAARLVKKLQCNNSNHESSMLLNFYTQEQP